MIRLLLIIIFFYSCDQKTRYSLNIDIVSNDKIYTNNSEINLKSTLDGITIDNAKITYYYNDNEINKRFSLDNSKLGTNTIKARVNIEGLIITGKKSIDVYSNITPKLYNYEIINEFSHDISSYTQGLEFYNGFLYESTGLNGYSTISKIDLLNDKVLEKKYLENKYFGEGLTIINDNLIQLTWKNKIGFIYDPNTLDLKNSFNYDKNTEGWGLANDGEFLYLSDGSSKIRVINPESFKEIDFFEVVTNNRKIKNINELEIVDNIIYANTYQSNKDVVLKIDKNNGKVLGLINFDGLRDKVKKHPELDVLNGIAYNKSRNTFFITGKKWNKVFEVKIIKD